MSSSIEKVRNKDMTSFHRLCSDLHKFIQKRIIKKYINPQFNSDSSSLNKNKEWKYINSKERITEEDKMLDLFKDNAFLAQLKEYYESLEKILFIMDENEKNIQLLKEDIQLGDQKLGLLSELNSHLNQFFNVQRNKNIQNNNSNNNMNSKGNNKNVVLDRIHLVKSLNILNELQIFNNNNNNANGDKNNKNNNTTSNTTITNNNNIILDNKIINNNIRESKQESQKEKGKQPLNEEQKNKDNSNSSKKNKIMNIPQKSNENSNNNNIKILNKKVKRDNSNFNEDDMSINSSKQKIPLINPSFLNNNNSSIEEKNQEPPPIPESNQVLSHEEKNEISEGSDGQTNLEAEFEKVLKDKFSFVFNISQNKIPKIKKELITEINHIIKKIPNLKYNKKDKFEDPYIVGSYSHFGVVSLMDFVPPIDILFKCKNIKGVAELKEIAEDTMKKKMGFNYTELGHEYDKYNEIVKFYHKCKITKGTKDNTSCIFIYFNIFFVGVNLSNFNKKETCINRFYFNNNSMYDNSGKILISLYFRRWRKKYNLYFMMPEFIDIIISFYYNEKNNLSFVIEEIFLALFDRNFKFLEKNEGDDNSMHAAEDLENLKEIKKYIFEWYNNEEYKKKMSDAILDTQELIMNSKFFNTFNMDLNE